MDLSGQLASVVTQLRALDASWSVDTDPAGVMAPGIVVQLADLQRLTLGGGWQYGLNLVLVAADTDDGPGPAAALGAMLATLLAWAQPDGPIVARSVQLPSGPAPLPGMVFPLQIRTDA